MSARKMLLALLAFSFFALTSCVFAPGSSLKLSDADAEKVGYEVIEIDHSVVLSKPVDFRLRYSKSNETEKTVIEEKYEYHVGSQDVLSIQVWNHPELSSRSAQRAIGPLVQRRQQNRLERLGNSGLDRGIGSIDGFTVGVDGAFFFPYVGEVQAEGRTIDIIRKNLTRMLSTFIKEPQVSVRVQEFNSQKVQVLGEVAMPGPLAITNKPTKVLGAIALAGGLTSDGDRSEACLVRSNGDVITIDLLQLFSGDLTQNIILKDGDVLHLDTNRYRQILIMGEVGKVAAMPYDARGMSLNDALVAASGLNQRAANAKGIYVLRNNQNGSKAQIFQLNLKNASSMLLADRFPLKARDVIYVDTSDIARWGRVINQLFPSLRFLDDATPVK